MVLAKETQDPTIQPGEYASGLLYGNSGFSLGRLLSERFISRVELNAGNVELVRQLSAQGVVVFAQKNRSQLNSLILRDVFSRNDLPVPFFCHDINMSFWQPAGDVIRKGTARLLQRLFSRKAYDERANNFFRRIVRARKSSLVYLRGLEFLDEGEDPLRQLIDFQKELPFPVYLAPVVVSYGKRREKKDKTLLEIIFGPKENPGPLRRMITFIRYSKKAMVSLADPISLPEYLEKSEARTPEGVAYQLRRELTDRINEEKRALIGPVLKSREELILNVLRDTYLVKFMEEMATRERKDYKAVLKEAEKYLKEIAADYNELYIDVWDKLLTWLWDNIYEGVVIDREGMARIRDISKRMPFVIVPCHRSHIDYLLLSYCFDRHSIQLPFVAAGTNLLFWPAGHIFRKSGAFFVRRSFRGNQLYGAVFAKYMKVLLKEGLPIEFFIEGGRSRTGKMVMPRYGLLSMIIQAFKEGISSDLAIIPVFIGYDRVMEEKSYLDELGGAPKKKENARSVLRSGSLLRKRYGSVYLNVGEPIFLKSYLAALEKPFEDMDMDERRPFYRRIGYEIVDEINKVSIVTPFALAACCLLSQCRRGISHEDLLIVFRQLSDYLSYRQVQFSSTLANRERAVFDALTLFETSGLITRMGIEEEDEEDEVEEIVYSIEDEKRLNLEYYKNNILHFFIPAAFVSTSILASNEDSLPLARIVEDYKFFKRLFINEFIFDHKEDDLEEVNAVLNYMNERGMVAGEEREDGAWIEVKGRGRKNLQPFAGLIHNYFESYWAVVRACSYVKRGSRPERGFLKKVQQLGTRMYKKGEITRAEALSSSNYESAVKYLRDSEILLVKRTRDKRDRETVAYTLNENRAKIEILRQRIFKFL